MNKPKRVRRSAQEILEERKAQLAAAEARAALEQARTLPCAVTLLEEIEAVNKDLTLSRRGFVKGRQNFENRLASHHYWITEIQAERDRANADISYLEEIKEGLNSALNEVIAESANGEISDEEVQALISRAVASADDLYGERRNETNDAYNEAQRNRKAYTESLKPKKNDKGEEGPTLTQEASA